MKKGKTHISQVATDDALDELIFELTETALASGGFVAYFGPDDEGDGAGQATPPGRRRW
jgi:hypothetical protein